MVELATNDQSPNRVKLVKYEYDQEDVGVHFIC